MDLAITGLYAAGLTVLGVGLGVSVSIMRARADVSIMHGDNMALAERIRRYGNFIELVPLALLLMAIAEIGGASSGWLHVIGALLLASRIIHPFGIDHKTPKRGARIIGSVGTRVSMLISIIFILTPWVS